MRKPMLTAVVLVVSLCACDGDDTTSDATTTAASEATPATSTTEAVEITDPTQPPVTTTLTTTTTTTTTTSTTSTTTTTTTSTTTTTVPPPTVEEAIAAAYQLMYDGYWACLRAPLNCDVSWLLPERESALAMHATMQALFDRGRYVGEEDPGYYVIESITMGDDGTTAEIITCWWSTAILYGPPIDDSRPVGPDNPATLANNTHGSGRQLDRLRLVDTRWLLEGSDGLDESSGINVCPPESVP